MIYELEKKIRNFLKRNADKKIVQKYARYFKEGYDSYGIDWDKFPDKREEWFRLCEQKLTSNEILNLSENLIKTGKYEEASIALYFFIRLRKNYNNNMFNVIGDWFQKYIINWAHCDWACGDILYFFIKDKIVSLKELAKWSASPSKWKRRAVPVTLVKLVSKDGYIKEGLSVAQKLMLDSERVVHQGVGWLLREIWKKSSRETEDFLYKWKDKAPRLVIQYATEKIDKEKRKRFRRVEK
ncbi:MAG: DNA alkylation repair protein [candidate division Zixibacteria bacterium]|nr:DNA alkylation repair protein [candidate division Zixibacteria bacterium]